MSRQYRAICPKGLEGLLQDELQSLGAESTRESPGSVHFTGDFKVAYRACLWSRLAKLFTLLSLTNPTYEPHEAVNRALAEARKSGADRVFPEDFLLCGMGGLGKAMEKRRSLEERKWKGMAKSARQEEDEEVLEVVRTLLVLRFYFKS